MRQNLFLSHNSDDKEKAQILANTISRITLNQISVWHSSDNSPVGGLRPGHVWLDEIRSQLNSSRAIVVLLTPKSIKTPWVLFESGFGAANPDCDVIPICVGIDNLSNIPFPLAMYQSYQLSDYNSLRRFVEKLLGKYGIPFDEEMVKPILTETINLIVENSSKDETENESKNEKSDIQNAINEIKSHIDQRLVGLLSSSLLNNGVAIQPEGWYSVEIIINFRDIQTTQFLEIGSETSVQDALDKIYIMLKDKLEPYKYLEQWILRDIDTGANLIIRDVQSLIPASLIFTKDRRWELLELSEPYRADVKLDKNDLH